MNRFFFDWLTDPEKNGAGAMMDFGCYNALWSLMYLGRPETVFAHSIQLRPGVPEGGGRCNHPSHLSRHGVALLEGSWISPRSFQQVEVFGLKGSLMADRQKAAFGPGRGAEKILPDPGLPPSRLEPIAYMLECIRTNQDPEGMVSMDFNVGVNEIIEAAKLSVKSGKAVPLPLK
ncbi:MAG: hypothetical protein U5J83_09045 [Bryobacterales bacterium]|nr:hypothetical protein [Bryobacterales bacterium]